MSKIISVNFVYEINEDIKVYYMASGVAFWMRDASGVIFITTLVGNIISGGIFPLDIFPVRVQGVLLQIVWIVVCWALGRVVWRAVEFK